MTIALQRLKSSGITQYVAFVSGVATFVIPRPVTSKGQPHTGTIGAAAELTAPPKAMNNAAVQRRKSSQFTSPPDNFLHGPRLPKPYAH